MSKLLVKKEIRRLTFLSRFFSSTNHNNNISINIKEENKYYKEEKNLNIFGIIASALIGTGTFLLTNEKKTIFSFDGNKQDFDYNPPKRDDLPSYKIDEIRKHNKNAERVWVTFKNGVYDVTEFVESHPGGDKILLAAGMSIEPFWNIYAQHKSAYVLEILESLRIGSVDENDLKILNEKSKEAAKDDPYSNDPPRHPALIVNSMKPFNAETPPSLLIDNFLTPNELFFVRNHMPVPEIDEKKHTLLIEGKNTKKSLSLKVEDLKKNYEEVSITSVVQCAGNRRADMHKYSKVQGLMWEGTAISNAKWSGVRLRDLLLDVLIDPNDKTIKHVHFEGADTDPAGTPYGASIPFKKAMSEECIIAYSMNDKPIPPDHGYPLRAIVPGNVGARQVKWLKKIILSEEESSSHWQQKDYRAFSPSVKIGDQLDFQSVPAIQEYPIQSAICVPAPNTKISKEDKEFDVCGYAWSGGGKGIIRVEVSIDGGKTWQSAVLEQDPEQTVDEMYAWTLWRTTITIPDDCKDTLTIVCKATDRQYNTQPETASGIWNVRGLLHNAWHRVEINLTE
ncbi:Sulfite oxidase, mitochondrial [Strongyloides ratti]|uniref:sulfite oxidase n=1 Tax=Strongyloides ratti TaxID=34506 RepID=A0A090L3K1_STRRB|nr:Sulfite oxidase, mitochondrial [Strongyloides ratti]CEF64282.1 Sulfite oxidase, mitochondrial [Strongyloides ratti]